MKEKMMLSIERARKTMLENKGGPFGAAITDNMGRVIVVSSNEVLEKNDPTAHAEIVAIRKACEILKTYDLSGYVLYATGYPCPMCLSAIIWANISKVYYGTNLDEAEEIGFRDKIIYDIIQNNNLVDLKCLCHDEALELFKEYKEKQKEIY